MKRMVLGIMLVMGISASAVKLVSRLRKTSSFVRLGAEGFVALQSNDGRRVYLIVNVKIPDEQSQSTIRSITEHSIQNLKTHIIHIAYEEPDPAPLIERGINLEVVRVVKQHWPLFPMLNPSAMEARVLSVEIGEDTKNVA